MEEQAYLIQQLIAQTTFLYFKRYTISTKQYITFIDKINYANDAFQHCMHNKKYDFLNYYPANILDDIFLTGFSIILHMQNQNEKQNPF